MQALMMITVKIGPDKASITSSMENHLAEIFHKLIALLLTG